MGEMGITFTPTERARFQTLEIEAATPDLGIEQSVDGSVRFKLGQNEPADLDLQEGELAFWYDSHAGNIMAKGRSGGFVFTNLITGT